MTSETPRTDADTEPQDDIARYAVDLRRLRLDAGSPTLAKLQHDTGISRTVISDAFAGRTLPSARTVAGIVRACDADPTPWLDRRDTLAAAGVATGATQTVGDGALDVVESTDATVDDTPAPTPRRRVGLGMVALVAAVAFVAGALGSSAAALAWVPALISPPTASGAQIQVETGEDPALTECVDDSTTATGDTRADNSLLEIRWSDKCQAGWGRVTRYDGKSMGNTVTIAIYPQTAPDGPDRQEATEHDVQSAYTTLVVRPSPDTLLCAEGSFTVDGKRIDLGDPLCI